MTDEQERQAITAAIERLLAGKPLRSSGALDIVTLAEEAGLKRNKLTHKHTDLKDLFYAERKARDGIPDNEIKVRDEIAVLKEEITKLRAERDDYRIASETFARAMNVLTIENTTLRKEINKKQPSIVRPLPSLH
jgi:chromosome segregation ATPase